MELIINIHKHYFQEKLEYLKELDSYFYESGAGHLFSGAELEKLAYASSADYINEYAYPVMKPTIEKIENFANAYIYNNDAPKDVIISQLVNNKTFRSGKNKNDKQDRGSIEILKDNIKEFLVKPKVLPKTRVKKLEVVTKCVNQKNLKEPRVFTLKNKDELVKPNKKTWSALKELEDAYSILIKAGLEEKVNNKNATTNSSDKMKVSTSEELFAYKNARVLLKKDDDKIQKKANSLVSEFSSYLKVTKTPFEAEIEHRTNLRKLNALKGNIKKAVRKGDQVISMLWDNNNNCISKNTILERMERNIRQINTTELNKK